MRTELTASGLAQRVEGPLLFVRRSVNVGINEALKIIGDMSDMEDDSFAMG